MSEDASPSGSNREDQNSTWTVVKRKSRHSKRRAANPIDNKEESSPKKSPQTTDLPSVDELMAEYRRIRVQFETEPCAQKIRDLVAKNVVPGVRISNAINMGIGDFDPNDLLRPKRSSYVQLIAFQIMIEELEKITKHKIGCIFQEPAFSKADIEFITSLGHIVVEDPDGFSFVDDDTFFYGVHLYGPHYAKALEPHLPAIYVGTGWWEWERVMRIEGMKGIEKMDNLYKMDHFPQDPHSFAFASTCIYWKPTITHVAEDSDTKSDAQTPNQQADGEPTAEDEIADKLKSTTIS